MNKISLKEIVNKNPSIRIHLNKDYLQKLLIKSAKNNKPHCDIVFVKALHMKFTTNYLNNTIYGWIKKNRSIPANYLITIVNLAKENWNNVERNTLFVYSEGSRAQAKIIFPIKLDRKLGSIVGHILGDGAIDRKYNQVFFSNSDKSLLKEFEEYMKSIFNLEPRIWMQEKSDFGHTKWEKRLESIDKIIERRNVGLFYPTICGVILNSIFSNFAIGKDKKITKNIINSNSDFKKGLIRAFFDDEATVGKKNIRVFQDRKEILESFRSLLEELGITTNSIKTSIKNNKKHYYFDIFRKSNLKVFEQEIGFTSPKKNYMLNEIIDRKPHGNDK